MHKYVLTVLTNGSHCRCCWGCWHCCPFSRCAYWWTQELSGTSSYLFSECTKLSASKWRWCLTVAWPAWWLGINKLTTHRCCAEPYFCPTAICARFAPGRCFMEDQQTGHKKEYALHTTELHSVLVDFPKCLKLLQNYIYIENSHATPNVFNIREVYPANEAIPAHNFIRSRVFQVPRLLVWSLKWLGNTLQYNAVPSWYTPFNWVRGRGENNRTRTFVAGIFCRDYPVNLTASHNYCFQNTWYSSIFTAESPFSANVKNI